MSHVLIFHGRRICYAIKPNCAGCPVHDVCPSAFHAEKIGRKGSRAIRSGDFDEGGGDDQAPRLGGLALDEDDSGRSGRAGVTKRRR